MTVGDKMSLFMQTLPIQEQLRTTDDNWYFRMMSEELKRVPTGQEKVQSVDVTNT